jgi:hypothetical protein
VAKAYNLDIDVVKSTIHNLVAPSKSGTPYWGPGSFDMAGMDYMIRAQKLVGALSGDVADRRLSTPVSLPTTSSRKNKIERR